MSSIEECLKEINDLDGYASDTAFRPGFGDEGVSTDMSNVIVVDNLPSVPEAKFDKLMEFVTKVFSAFGELAEGGGITMPLNKETGATEGFAFVEFKTKEDATKAVTRTNNWDFDRNHKLTVMRYDVFQEYQKVPDEFIAPVPVAYNGQPDMHYWMMDDRLRDQFAVRYSTSEKQLMTGHETEIMWAEQRGAPALDYGGERQKSMGRMWTTSLVSWSSQGTYFTTMHDRGTILWSGKGFREGVRLLHSNVTSVLWSPDEKYVATWNGRADNDPITAREALVVWDVLTGARLRAFPQRRIQDAEPDFFWSADSKYLARIDVDKDTNTELIRIYEAPTFGLLDNRSIKAAGARDLSWCPRRQNLLAYWTPEHDNAPTTVYIMKVPSREYIRTRSFQTADSVQILWHPQGDYLAIISEKLTKAQARKKKAGKDSMGGPVAVGKPTTAGFSVELVRLNVKDTPIEVLDIKERVTAFAWEPHGSRFAIMQGDTPSKATVAFYGLPERGVPQHLFNLEDRSLNTLHWSPKGDFIALAGLQSGNGTVEFYDVERRRTLATVSHDVANSLEWDPSGRILATIKTQDINGAQSTRDTVGNGFILWTLQGTRICDITKPKVFQFLWRPRVENLLTDDESKEVAKNLKKYIGRYLDEDRQRKERKELLARLRKRKARDEFRAFLAERTAEWDSNSVFRVEAGIEAPQEEVIIFEDVYEVPLGEEVILVE